MKNLILKNSLIYRFYQNLIRKKKDDYSFFKYLFENSLPKEINMLDLGCGDSYILKFIEKKICRYIGVDQNTAYLNSVIKKENFYFIEHNLESIQTLKIPDNHNINFVFLNGVLHHFNETGVNKLLKYVKYNFPNAAFLSVDPVIENNNFINRLMIKFDRGKYIRRKEEYISFFKNYNYMITQGFFIMNFKLIFFYKGFDLISEYNNFINE